jgi:hypothetical protein
MKPWWVFVGEAFVRLMIALTPFMILITQDAKGCGLVGDRLKTAKDFSGVISSRLLLISWAPLAYLKVLMLADQKCGAGILASGITIMACATLALVALVLFVPTKWLKGYLPPILAFIFVALLDVIFEWYAVQTLAQWLCRL